MSKSAREIQEHLFDLGYIDRGNSPTLPFRIYEWCREHRVSAMALDAALGWKQGTTTQWVISKGLPHLTGEAPDAAPPAAPDGTQYGSGIAGTQADPAPRIDVYGPDDPLDPTPPEDPRASFLDWVERARFELPGDEISFFWEAKRRGLTHAQVEEYLGVSADDRGGIDRVARERGLM